jgi:O-antigen/teichoic acid export membrane protein
MTKGRLKVLGIGSDIGLAVILQGAGAVVNFAYQTVLLRSLSKEAAGIYFLTIAFVSLAGGLGDFGLVATVTPRVAVAGCVPTPAYRAAFHLRILALLTGILVLNVYLAVTGQWNILPYVNIAYVSIVISARATGVRQLVELMWRLRGRMYAISAIAVVDALIGLGALLVLQHYGAMNLTNVMLVLALSSLPGFVVVGMPLLREFRSLMAEANWRKRLPRSLYRALVVATLPIAAVAVVGQFAGQLETLVLHATTLNPSDVAAYNAAVRPLTALIFLATTFSFGLAPIVAQHYKRVRSDSSIEVITSLGVRILGFVSVLLAAICWIFAAKLMGIFGQDYVAEAYILQLYSVISGLVFLVVLFDQFLVATDRRRQAMVGAGMQLAVALAMEPIAVSYFGMRGLVAAKGISIVLLLAYQLSRFEPSIRRSALLGFIRLVPTIVAVVTVVLLTEELALLLRVLLVALGIAVVVLLVPPLRRQELRELQSIRITG